MQQKKTDKEPVQCSQSRLVAPLFTALVLVVMLSLAAGCTPKERPPLAIKLEAATVNGQLLWSCITEDDPFEDWVSWPNYTGLRPGQSPHGRFHKVFINRTLAGALPVPDNRAPDGSIIIKENYDPDRKVSNYTVMAKVQGYNPDAGDWFWAAFAPDGTVMAEGRVDMCINCHSASASDYVLLQRLDLGGKAGQ